VIIICPIYKNIKYLRWQQTYALISKTSSVGGSERSGMLNDRSISIDFGGKNPELQLKLKVKAE